MPRIVLQQREEARKLMQRFDAKCAERRIFVY
jgi:hypothetical protein